MTRRGRLRDGWVGSCPGRRAWPLALAVVLTWSGALRAQSSLDAPYPDGFALNVFEPAPAGDRFFGVADAASFRDGKLRAHLVGDLALGDVVERTDDVTGEKATLVSRELYLHAGVAYPITDFLHAHASVPFAAYRGGNSAATPDGGKFGDVRLGLRANVIASEVEAFAFGPAVDVWLPTGSPDHLTGDGQLRVNPKLAASGRAGAFVYAASAGYLVRRKVDTGSLETGDAVTFGAAAGVVLWERVQIGPEIFGNRQVSPRWNDTEVLPLSALFGAKVRIADFVAGAAAGPGLSEAPGVSPRVVLSLAFAPDTHVRVSGGAQPASTPPETNEQEEEVATHKMPPLVMDSDGDGVGDDKDACPDKLGDRSDDPMQNGCPKPRIADGDGDGVRDEVDACPDAAGVEKIDPRANGCPEKAGAPPPPPANAEPKQIAPQAAAPASGRGADITFAGFQVMPDGTSRLTVRFTSVPAMRGTVTGTTTEFVIAARIPSRNNENPLLARHFGAEVLSARLSSVKPRQGQKNRQKNKAASAEARLVVVTREPVTPSHRLVENPDGSATLFVDFPRPSHPPPPEKVPAARPKTDGT